MNLKSLPSEERPRERFIKYGRDNISNEELIEIILKSGTRKYGLKEISHNILSSVNNINELKNMEVNTLSKINGVGNIKAIELMAAIELGRRVYLEDNYKELVYLTNPESIINYFHNLFDGIKQELFYVIYLDNQKKYIKEDIKNNMSITFIASLFDEYERNDTQVKEIINVFKNIDINFKEVHLIDNRVSKEDVYKYIEKTDIVYLMGGSPELEMKSIIEYNLFNILRNRNGITIGTSAGAMNQTDRVIYKDDFKNYELVDYQGLGFIDLNIYPHFDIDNKEYMDEVFEVSKYARIVGLPNESFIRIKDNDIDFVGKHYFIENGVME